MAAEAHRNYCATVLLSEPDTYRGGELEFFKGWGDQVLCRMREIRWPGCDGAVSALRWGWLSLLRLWQELPCRARLATRSSSAMPCEACPGVSA